METPFDPKQNIIAGLGLQDLPEEERLALIEQMAEVVEKRVVVRLMDALPETDVEEANRLADDPSQLLAFLSSKAGDISEVIREETEKFKAEMREAADDAAPPEDEA